MHGDWLPGELLIPHLVTLGREQPGQVGEGGHQGPVHVGAPDHHLGPVVCRAEPVCVPLTQPAAELQVTPHAPLGQLPKPPRPRIVLVGVIGVRINRRPVSMPPDKVNLKKGWGLVLSEILRCFTSPVLTQPAQDLSKEPHQRRPEIWKRRL